MKKFIILILFCVYFIFPLNVFASGENVSGCDNRYLTLINPVRGRNLWFDKSLEPIKGQYFLIKENDFSATWLLQYDVFSDSELIREIKNFDDKQEKGVLLEISKNLGDQARVIYPYDAPWFSPKAVFLSAYTQSERRRLIDEIFNKFKEQFGYYPKSIGAWWIDSYSLNYLKEKYNIKAALIVADQKTTDNYGVWGQWWGVPYYPSKANILSPASNLANKQEVVIIQWAQRDPLLAMGEGANYSNYSLQANDYIRQGKDTQYFKDLVSIYLDCKNQLGQITVGLETGIESVGYLSEYKNQLVALKQINKLKSFQMSQFADAFMKVYPDFPKKVVIGSQDSEWVMQTQRRFNTTLVESTGYDPAVSFKDYFLADKAGFLDRKLPISESKKSQGWFPIYLLVVAGMGVLAYRKKAFKIWIASTAFTLTSFGLILRSGYENGWQVFYEAAIPNLGLVQAILVFFSFIFILVLSKLKKDFLYLWLLPISFGIDPLLQALRFTMVSGKYYFGFATDAFHFIGLSFVKPFNFGFVNQDFPAYQAAALLRLDFGRIWDNVWFSVILYPLSHVVLALIAGFILLHFPKKVRKILIVIMVVLLVFHIISIFNADPRFAVLAQ